MLETRAWRERLFAARAPSRRARLSARSSSASTAIRNVMLPGMMGGGRQLALNQLLS